MGENHFKNGVLNWSDWGEEKKIQTKTCIKVETWNHVNFLKNYCNLFDPESTILIFVNTTLCLVRAYPDVLTKTGPKQALYLPLA